MTRALVAVAVTVAVVVCLAVAAASTRVVRQASSRCSEGSCVLLSRCPELLRLLRPLTTANYRRLESLRCGLEGGRAQVCCPGVTTTTSPPPVTTPRVSPGEDLLPQSCGHSLETYKLWGGTEANLGAYPWMAVLGYTELGTTATHWGCGASLVNERYVLTAAHCTDPNILGTRKLFVVRLGEHNLETQRDCQDINGGHQTCAPSHQDFNIAQTVVHPTYNRRSLLENDIALLRLERPVQFTNFISPICLPKPGSTVAELVGSSRVTVTGWGNTELGVRSTKLLQVSLPLVPHATCRQAANYDSYLLTTPGQICLGGEARIDSCEKDSGGPAQIPVLEDDIISFTQVGLVSYGPENCGTQGVPGVYTDVTVYRQWIVDNLRP